MDLSNINWSQCANSGLNGLKDYLGSRFNKITILDDKCYTLGWGVILISTIACSFFVTKLINKCIKSMIHRRMEIQPVTIKIPNDGRFNPIEPYKKTY